MFHAPRPNENLAIGRLEYVEVLSRPRFNFQPVFLKVLVCYFLLLESEMMKFKVFMLLCPSSSMLDRPSGWDVIPSTGI